MGAIQILFPPSLGADEAQRRADRVAEALAERLERPVEADIALSYEELSRRILSADVEVAWAPPALCADAGSAVRTVFKVVRAEGAGYRAALICRRDAALHLSDLAGKKAAWVDPLSTAGHRLPAAHLRRQGVAPEKVLRGQVYVGSYRAALEAVATGNADFCSIYTSAPNEASVLRSLSEVGSGFAETLAPFAYTDPSPGDGLVLTRRLSEADAQRLIILLSSRDRIPVALLEACRAEGFVQTDADEYARLSPSRMPPPKG